MKTIQTFKPSEGGSISGRGQGTVEHIIEREWIAALPEVEEPEVEAPKGDEPAPTE